MLEQIRADLKITVIYNVPDGMSPSDAAALIREQLEDIPRRAAGAGMYTGYTELETDTYTHTLSINDYNPALDPRRLPKRRTCTCGNLNCKICNGQQGG